MKETETDQNPTYPLHFDAKEDESVKTFEECHDEHLVSKEKYVMYSKEVKDFYDGGVHKFLVDMEKRYEEHECSGICKKNLFYLTQDISLGMPKIECVEAAVRDADA